MLSAKEIAAVKVAVEICNSPKLKAEILCAPGSRYAAKLSYRELHDDKRRWDRIVARKASIILNKLCLLVELQKVVQGLIRSVGMRMLTWAVYHEHTFDLSREYILEFLNSSFFTQLGIIDSKKAAEVLVNDENLSIKQKYKLACIYCFTEHLPVLYGQLAKEDKDTFHGPQFIHQPKLVQFWSYCMMRGVDKLVGQESRFDIAVADGSKAAIEYFLEKTNLSNKEDFVVGAALETLRNRIRSGRGDSIFDYVDCDESIIMDDWIVFLHSHTHIKDLYTPSDYYVDILCFLLSRMTESQRIEFLQKDIEGVHISENPGRSRVLEYFLDWPYQDYFVRTANLMWEFLPERSYADLLLEIFYKIEKNRCRADHSISNLKYNEGESYNYRKLFREFWERSPERYKRYIFCDKKRDDNGHIVRLGEADKHSWFVRLINEGKDLLVKLFKLNNFTYEDNENIRIILESATNLEKEKIIFSDVGSNICIKLMREERWETLDKFVLNCIYDKEAAHEFKRNFACTEKAQHICIDFVINNKWNAAESFIKWSALPEEGVLKLKNEMISSRHGKYACVELFSYHTAVKDRDKLIQWCFPTEEKVTAFKKELIFSDTGLVECADFVIEDKLELANEFIHFCLSFDEEIKELKENVAKRKGCSVWEKLISSHYKDFVYDEEGDAIGRWIKFKGGKWEAAEKLLTWCFATEEEISSFKKNVLLETSGEKIHFELILCNRWGEAEIFFAWLELSPEEIKMLKKKTLFDYYDADQMFYNLLCSEEGDARFIDFGSKEEAIELFLRWFLTDKETVLEFKVAFKSSFQGETTEEREVLFEYFDLMIEQRLRDLDDEKI